MKTIIMTAVAVVVLTSCHEAREQPAAWVCSDYILPNAGTSRVCRCTDEQMAECHLEFSAGEQTFVVEERKKEVLVNGKPFLFGRIHDITNVDGETWARLAEEVNAYCGCARAHCSDLLCDEHWWQAEPCPEGLPRVNRWRPDGRQ